MRVLAVISQKAAYISDFNGAPQISENARRLHLLEDYRSVKLKGLYLYTFLCIPNAEPSRKPVHY